MIHEEDSVAFVKYKQGTLTGAEYFRTNQWFEIKKEAMLNAGGKCQMCEKKRVALYCYDKTYCKPWKEDITNVLILCYQCYLLHYAVDKTVIDKKKAENSKTWRDGLMRNRQEETKKLSLVLETFFDMGINLVRLREAIKNDNLSSEVKVIAKKRLEDSCRKFTDFEWDKEKGIHWVLSTLGFIKMYRSEECIYSILVKKVRFLIDKNILAKCEYGKI